MSSDEHFNRCVIANDDHMGAGSEHAKSAPPDFVDQPLQADFFFHIKDLPFDDAAGFGGPTLENLKQPVVAVATGAGCDSLVHHP